LAPDHLAIIDVFVFREGLPRRGNAHVCVVDQYAARRFVSTHDLDQLFFGHVVYGDDAGRRFVGVWGNRTVSRFLRLLRERGASFVQHASPPPARFTAFVTQGKARAKSGRVR